MAMRFPLWLAALACAGAALPQVQSVAPASQPISSTAEAAAAVLEKNCASCHGPSGQARSYMLLDPQAMIRTGKVTPGRAEDSILYKRLTGVITPIMPAGGARLSEGDIAIVKRWIDDGAPPWNRDDQDQPRRFISNDEVIAAIERDLRSMGPDTDRRFTRYFTLTNLWNAGDKKLPAHRLALAKLLNSLSWDKDIVLPTAIDAEGTILRVDLRDYDWTDPTAAWETILAGYPYLFEFRGRGYAAIQALTSSDTPFIRADWFTAAAAMPPLYHEILDLPSNETDLESCGGHGRRCLNINTEGNLRDSPGVRVVRAGFVQSGVSNNNRIVERHRSPYGAYWKSHDFPDNLGEHNILRRPLDFKRAGGEIIFNLPNGLQAYLLVNENGERIDQAPTHIVFNKGGSRAEIRNGVSCIGCHAGGMRPFTDEVRASLAALPEHERRYALALYADNSVLRKLVSQDQERFESALLKMGVRGGDEPVSELSERYAMPLDAVAAAAELGMSPSRFVERLQSSETLRQLGLATLASGGTVKRDAWEDAFGEVAEEMQAGRYIPPVRAYGERFFSGPPLNASTPSRGRRARVIIEGLLGRTIRTVENGWNRTYSVKDVQIPDGCTIQIADATRFEDPNDAARWWLEEDVQTLSLGAVRVSRTSVGGVERLLVIAAGGAIQLERAFSSSNWRGDARFPPSGRRTEAVHAVQFDVPPGSPTDSMFQALREAADECRRRP